MSQNKWDCIVDTNGFSLLPGDNTYPNDTCILPNWPSRMRQKVPISSSSIILNISQGGPMRLCTMVTPAKANITLPIFTAFKRSHSSSSKQLRWKWLNPDTIFGREVRLAQHEENGLCWDPSHSPWHIFLSASHDLPKAKRTHQTYLKW